MAETKTVNLNVETNLGSLKSQLKEAQRDVEKLSEKFGATSTEATNAARKAAQLKDAIGDAKALTDAFNPDAKFNALGGALQGVAGGFSAVQGAMGLVGVESKDLEETMLKVQSAMALSQGINSVLEAKDAFTNLKAVIGQTAIGQKLLTAAQVVGAAAMRVLNIVMAANPILLIVSGITAAVSAFYLLTRSTDKNAEAQKELNRQNELSIRLMKIQQEDADKYISSLEKNSKNKIALAKAEGANSEEIYQLEKARLEDQIRYRKVLHDFGTKLTAEQYAQQKQDKFDLKILEAQHNTDLLNAQKDSNTKIKAENKSKNDKLVEDNYNRYLKEKEDADNFLKQQEIDSAYFKSIDDTELARKQALKDQEAADTEMLSAFKIEQWEFEAARQKQLDDDELARKRRLEGDKLQAVRDGLTTIGNLAELFAGKSRKQQENAFKIQKAANIASATIDTYRAVQGAVASTPGGPIIKAAAGVVMLTAGLLNIKKIASTKFDAGGSTGGGGGSTPSGGGGGEGGGGGTVITPNFNIVGNNGTNQLAQLKQAPIQAYVVSGEMSTQQSLDRNRLRNATL